MLNLVNERCIVLHNRLLLHQLSSSPQNNHNLPVSLTSNLFHITNLLCIYLKKFNKKYASKDESHFISNYKMFNKRKRKNYNFTKLSILINYKYKKKL